MLTKIRKPIDGEMLRFEEKRGRVLTSQNPLLGLALAHVASRQGKMMRPMLVYLMAKTAAATYGTAQTLHAALALELLHTASLVHDDVVDESDRRRGQASVNALYDNKAAVLVGDYILSCALREAALTESPRFVEVIATLGKTLADGELLQLHNMDTDDITEEQYYDVIRRKTASLFATCAAAPYILAADNNNANHAYRLGELIGIIFQMRDDIFDLSTSDTGKPAGNDMREGKLTLPTIHAVTSDHTLREPALRVRRHEATETDIATLSAAARTHGIAYAERQMQQLINEAHEAVKQIATSDNDVADALHTYIDHAAQRQK